MLRHSCGYKLANDGIDTRAIQDWLGNISIVHTTRYTALSPTRFRNFWRNAPLRERMAASVHRGIENQRPFPFINNLFPLGCT